MGSRMLLLLVVALLFGAGSARSQEVEAPAGTERPDRSRGVGQDTRKLLEEVLMARMTKELALDEAQTVLMVRHLAEHREKMAALRRERAQLVRSVKQAVRESSDESKIASLLEEVIAHDQKLARARSEILDVEGIELTTWQKARLYLFINDFEGDMRRLLHRAQERRNALGKRTEREESAEPETPEPQSETAEAPREP